MAGSGSRARGTAVASPVSAEGVLLSIGVLPRDFANPSLASLPGPGNTVTYDISGVVNYTAGAGTTAVVLRCRRNSVTGPQVGTSQTVTLAAAASANIAFDFIDVLTPVIAAATGDISNYVITIQQTGGTGAGTANEIVGHLDDYL